MSPAPACSLSFAVALVPPEPVPAAPDLNQITSFSTMVANMPIALENDRVAIAAALATSPPRDKTPDAGANVLGTSLPIV